jgi:hypothetical protein
MKKIIVIVSFLLVSSVVYANEIYGSDFKPCFFAFRQAIFFSEKNDRPHTERYLRIFLNQWDSFYGGYAHNPPVPYKKLKDYNRMMLSVKAGVIEAQKLADKNAFFDVSRKLDDVRRTLWEIDKKAGAETLADKLNDFYYKAVPFIDSAELAETPGELKEIWNKDSGPVKEAWARVDSTLKEMKLSACINYSELVQTGLMFMEKAAERGDFDLAVEAGEKIIKGYEMVYYSPYNYY